MDKGGTRGKYAFFSILVAFLDATKRTSSAPIRFDRWLELFLPTARLHHATNVSDGSLLRKQSGRKENRSVRPSGNFRIAIIEAGVSSLMENYASGCLWERSFRNDSKVTRGYFLSDRSFRFFERANLWKLILRNHSSKGIFNAWFFWRFEFDSFRINFNLWTRRYTNSKKVFNYIISILRIFFNYHRTTRCSHSIRYLLVRYHIY